MIGESSIEENYNLVMERIQVAAQACGRSPSSIQLVVVTKGHPVPAVRRVLSAGARILGENYFDEAVGKMQALSSVGELEWHMIGHVQSRKARQVSEHFACVHSLDSYRLAERLDRFAGEKRLSLPVLMECNVSGEESKYGWPAWDEADWPDLLAPVADVLALPHLKIRGLMTMPPFSEDMKHSRPYFIHLRRLQAFLKTNFPYADWDELSMGMSADFEVAIQEGATFVRVGTAIMGPRSY
jgi:pyridoxal phosphate enzyme (YggS family)